MDQVTLVKNQYRLERWTELIRECQSSGMKVNDWCEANGVTHHAYYYWLRKIRQAACKDLPAVTSANVPVAFKKLNVQTPSAEAQAAVIVHLPTVTLEVQNGASRETVEAVLYALRSLC